MQKLRCLFILTSTVALALAAGCVIVPVESAEVPTSATHNSETAANTRFTSLPVINSFEAKPELVSQGIPVTLRWNVFDATSVTIQPNIGKVKPIGNKQLSPTATTTYTLTAINSAGSKTATITATVTPDENTQVVDVDPVTGSNDEFELRWEQLCVASEYQVQIAKDPDFTLVVVDTGPYAPADVTSPAAYYPAGGKTVDTSTIAPSSALDPGTSAIGSPSMLEAGYTYYARVRVRQTASGQHMLSPWSEVYKFTIKSGLPTANASYGPQPLSPNNGCLGCPVSPVSFSWAPFQDTTKYKFMLAEDAAMAEILVEIVVPTSAYEYEGVFKYSTNYYWRVMALEPVPSDWSATFTFRTESAPLASPTIAETPITPTWAWVFIGIGAVLIIAVIVLIILARRRR